MLVGASEYDVDDILFRRYWGSGEAHASLVDFIETIENGTGSRRIHQRCMLYARPVGRGEGMLLVNMQQDLAKALAARAPRSPHDRR